MSRLHVDRAISVETPVLGVTVWDTIHVLVVEAQKRGYEVTSERFYLALAEAFHRVYCIWWVDRRVRDYKLAIRYRVRLETDIYV